jgi:hypothetical protein
MEKRRHFAHFHIAGFTYWDGCIVFRKLKTGTEPKLLREAGNKFDPYAAAIYYGNNKPGFIPRDRNKEINKFPEQGYDDIFEVHINRIDGTEYPENQVHMIVYLKGKEDMGNGNTYITINNRQMVI